MISELTIRRLGAEHAPAIAECFRRVYGNSYANELFYDVPALVDELKAGRLNSVGAVAPDDRVLAHMAMVRHPAALFAELGNTVVDPAARGAGIAWQVGAELTNWCIECGHDAYLHYPTTDHHIMQRQSVKAGFETGLMLGYIPAQTDGQVNPDKPALRGAATIVVNPLGPCPEMSVFPPSDYADRLRSLASAATLPRRWQTPTADALPKKSTVTAHKFHKRQLARLEVGQVGQDIHPQLRHFAGEPSACRQVDFSMADAGIDVGVRAAISQRFTFCGWLPGYRSNDVFRMQLVEVAQADMTPDVINAEAKSMLELCQAELATASR